MQPSSYNNRSHQIYSYFVTIIAIITLSILSLWTIRKPRITNGYLSIIKKQTACYYVFNSGKPVIKQKGYQLLVNNKVVTDFLSADYEIKDNQIIFLIEISCNNDRYYQPAIIIYSEINLISYLINLFWT